MTTGAQVRDAPLRDLSKNGILNLSHSGSRATKRVAVVVMAGSDGSSVSEQIMEVSLTMANSRDN